MFMYLDGLDTYSGSTDSNKHIWTLRKSSLTDVFNKL